MGFSRVSCGVALSMVRNYCNVWFRVWGFEVRFFPLFFIWLVGYVARPRPLLVLSSSSPRPRRDRATATAATATATATPTPTGTATATTTTTTPTPTGTATATTTTTTAATTTSPTPLPHPPPPALPNYSCLQHCVLNPMLYKLYQNNRTERRNLSAECEGLARTVELQGIRAGDLCGRKRLGRGWRKRWSFGCEAYWTKPLY